MQEIAELEACAEASENAEKSSPHRRSVAQPASKGDEIAELSRDLTERAESAAAAIALAQQARVADATRVVGFFLSFCDFQ